MKTIGLLILLLLLLACTGCTAVGLAVGEGFDQRSRDTVSVPLDSLRVQLQEGTHVQIDLRSGDVLTGNVIRVEKEELLLNQWEEYPWPNGGRVERRYPLTSIQQVQMVERPIRGRVIGAVTGAAIDTVLVLFLLSLRGLSGLGG